MKLLINTGSTKSFINPDLAEKYYSKFIFKKQFTVSTVLQISTYDFCANISIFNEFKHNGNFEFYLFKFHDFYDVLLGLDNIELLNANLDFQNYKLLTPFTIIHIQYKNTAENIPFIGKIDANSKVITKIPLKQNSGDIIVPRQIVQDCEIPEIFNKSDPDILIN